MHIGELFLQRLFNTGNLWPAFTRKAAGLRVASANGAQQAQGISQMIIDIHMRGKSGLAGYGT